MAVVSVMSERKVSMAETLMEKTIVKAKARTHRE